MDRITRLLGAANRSQLILELGAGYCPVAPKSGGWQTHVVDHAPQDELRAKYAPAHVDTNLIESVDTIWRGGALHEAVPAELLGQVDLIIASHVLEHIPDLIGFFHSASQLVRFGGSLSIALPDRRYCFDCFRPWTTTGCLLDAHQRRMSRHSLRTAFDHVAYSAKVDEQLAWGPRSISEPIFIDPFVVAETTVNLYSDQPSGPYQDYHAWQFTPSAFQLIMLELSALDMTDWLVTTVHGPENFEFFVTLRHVGTHHLDPVSLQSRRRELLIAQLAETREQIDFMMGSASVTPLLKADIEQGLIAKLTEQDRVLQEMSETLRWLRAVLSPIRRVRRAFRRGG